VILLKLAARNVRRNVVRSSLSLVAVIVGTMSLIVGHAFLAGLRVNVIRSQIDVVSGDAVLRPVDYPDERLTHPVDALFTVEPDLAGWLDANTQAWTTRVMFVPTAIHGPDSIRVRGIGFDPARDEAVFPRDAWKVVGHVPKSGEEGVLVASSVARLLSLHEGDVLTMQVRTAAGAINALQMPVAGIVAASNPWVDRSAVFVPMDLADNLLQAHGAISHVATRLADHDEADVDAFAAELKAHGGATREVSTWMAETHDILEIDKMRSKALNMLVGVLMAMSAMGIANTVLMAAYERIREIGTLRALGMAESEVLALFLTEGVVLGVVGSTIGCAISTAIVMYFTTHGIDLSASIDRSGGMSIPISTMLYVAYESKWVILAWTFGVGIATIASVLPARMAARMAPADAVRA
jgi:putative ABC transport system permease protein